MLNNSGDSGQPSLFPDLSGNGFSFSPLRTMLAVVVVGAAVVVVGAAVVVVGAAVVVVGAAVVVDRKSTRLNSSH